MSAKKPQVAPMGKHQTRRNVVEVRPPTPGHWVGDGFHVRTMLTYSEDPSVVSPFLLLDYAAPAELSPTERRRGVGEHPHRGFETVTIAYEGEIEHRDSAGNHGRISKGDVQWMTAGSGIVHEEMLGTDFSHRGGVLEMAQIWVNIPRESKMSSPRYQDIAAARIPTVALPNQAGAVRIIAGEFMGVKGPARTFTPINMWDLRLSARGKTELAMPDGHTAMLLVRKGPVVINGGTSVAEGHLVLLDRKGESFSLESETESAILVLGGEPIPGPVVGYGPFVMNTREEIVQAVNDFQDGRMGHISEVPS
jgi:redox-sensitive bicupin YhaK (pirin superfamily)